MNVCVLALAERGVSSQQIRAFHGPRNVLISIFVYIDLYFYGSWEFNFVVEFATWAFFFVICISPIWPPHSLVWHCHTPNSLSVEVVWQNILLWVVELSPLQYFCSLIISERNYQIPFLLHVPAPKTCKNYYFHFKLLICLLYRLVAVAQGEPRCTVAKVIDSLKQ